MTLIPQSKGTSGATSVVSPPVCAAVVIAPVCVISVVTVSSGVHPVTTDKSIKTDSRSAVIFFIISPYLCVSFLVIALPGVIFVSLIKGMIIAARVINTAVRMIRSTAYGFMIIE